MRVVLRSPADHLEDHPDYRAQLLAGHAWCGQRYHPGVYGNLGQALSHGGRHAFLVAAVQVLGQEFRAWSLVMGRALAKGSFIPFTQMLRVPL